MKLDVDRSSGPEIGEDSLAAWRAFLTAHAVVTRRISRDLSDAGLPDLSWYDLLWALDRRPQGVERAGLDLARRRRDAKARPATVRQLADQLAFTATAGLAQMLGHRARFLERVEERPVRQRHVQPGARHALSQLLPLLLGEVGLRCHPTLLSIIDATRAGRRRGEPPRRPPGTRARRRRSRAAPGRRLRPASHSRRPRPSPRSNATSSSSAPTAAGHRPSP